MTNEHDVKTLLYTYEQALNNSDAALAASCYTAGGVFMPTAQPTATGDGLREAYEQIFSAIRLNVTFTIDELVIASDDIAYALTRSKGTQTVLADGTRDILGLWIENTEGAKFWNRSRPTQRPPPAASAVNQMWVCWLWNSSAAADGASITLVMGPPTATG